MRYVYESLNDSMWECIASERVIDQWMPGRLKLPEMMTAF